MSTIADQIMFVNRIAGRKGSGRTDYLLCVKVGKWKDEKGRKPLFLSGARQVGKSYVIEQNFTRHFEQLLTINFEKQPEFQNSLI